MAEEGEGKKVAERERRGLWAGKIWCGEGLLFGVRWGRLCFFLLELSLGLGFFCVSADILKLPPP